MTDEKIVTLLLPYPDREDRIVRVFIPAHEEGETLPVIYMTDGQNLFEEHPKALGCWHIPEVMRSERSNSGQAAIVVGIHNIDPWRGNELTPGTIGEIICPEEMRPYVHPEGEIFDDFVVNTVMPAVESQFPVKTGRANTAFCGSSSGGLQSFFTALSHPDIFCAAGVFSPCFMLYSEDDMNSWIHSKLTENNPFLYIYSGGSGDLEQMIMSITEKTGRILADCYSEKQLKIVISPEQPHHEKAWEIVFKDFLHYYLVNREEY